MRLMRKLLFTLVLVFAVAVATPASLASHNKRAPRLTGMERSDAECKLAKANLRWRYGPTGKVRSKPRIACGREFIAPGHQPKIQRQRPRPGRHICEHGIVTLWTGGDFAPL